MTDEGDGDEDDEGSEDCAASRPEGDKRRGAGQNQSSLSVDDAGSSQLEGSLWQGKSCFVFYIFGLLIVPFVVRPLQGDRRGVRVFEGLGVVREVCPDG